MAFCVRMGEYTQYAQKVTPLCLHVWFVQDIRILYMPHRHKQTHMEILCVLLYTHKMIKCSHNKVVYPRCVLCPQACILLCFYAIDTAIFLYVGFKTLHDSLTARINGDNIVTNILHFFVPFSFFCRLVLWSLKLTDFSAIFWYGQY